MRRPNFVERLRDWFRSTRVARKSAAREPSVWNQPAPASRAGDAPIITSHGRGPSHAH